MLEMNRRVSSLGFSRYTVKPPVPLRFSGVEIGVAVREEVICPLHYEKNSSSKDNQISKRVVCVIQVRDLKFLT